MLQLINRTFDQRFLKYELKNGHKADDPNDIFFIWEVDDPVKFKEAADKDQGLHEIMAKAGVIGGMNITVLKEF